MNAVLTREANTREKQLKRGEIWMADLSNARGCEQGGLRPVVVIQNNKGNLHAPTTIIAPISSSTYKNKIPTHVHLTPQNNGVIRDSIVLAEQIKVIDKKYLQYKLAELDQRTMMRIDSAINISLGLS